MQIDPFDNNKIQNTILVFVQLANNFIWTIYNDLCVLTYIYNSFMLPHLVKCSYMFTSELFYSVCHVVKRARCVCY